LKFQIHKSLLQPPTSGMKLQEKQWRRRAFSKSQTLIIDEIHLLHEDRGLSATIPNYVDVARFLGDYFILTVVLACSIRTTFFCVKCKPDSIISNNKLNMNCWKKVLDLVREKHQVMVFVHSREDTVRTAKVLHEFASYDGHSGNNKFNFLLKKKIISSFKSLTYINKILDLFDVSTLKGYSLKMQDVMESRNKDLKELFQYGLSIHHAGMLEADRSMTERLFSEGFIK
ncbi:325_t:CDS:2, partial [Funneliformis geosporum]